eukprot:CAMPEP_0185265790 /NCGR_PEP_ID=MMETSP1359-20130426/28821_1 /TAXON_ID=552665 /ORGANISM="Bigelowiella longifila, Strain CCMP242" /LENGTH=218 /DNA_ID=CAMNT_0027855273 /DNA_START=60 /DNA_END=715 /DNA_ORIENTATION=+
MTPHQLARSYQSSTEADTYVWLGKPSEHTTKCDLPNNATWHRYEGCNSHWGADAEILHNYTNPLQCKKICHQKGYSGFVLWRGDCYFRSGTKDWDDLRRSRVKSAEHTLYIKVPLVVNQSEFELIPMSESCEGQDADSLLHFESLHHCQVKCVEGNYGGFVTWNGHAYFRKMNPQALVKAAGAEEYNRSLGVAPSPSGGSAEVSEETSAPSCSGCDIA